MSVGPAFQSIFSIFTRHLLDIARFSFEISSSVPITDSQPLHAQKRAELPKKEQQVSERGRAMMSPCGLDTFGGLGKLSCRCGVADDQDQRALRLSP